MLMCLGVGVVDMDAEVFGCVCVVDMDADVFGCGCSGYGC